MGNQIQSYDIYNAIAQLEEVTSNHNSTFDAANKIFSDAEKALARINLDYWYPYHLYPRLNLQSAAMPSMLPLYAPPQPFSGITYHLGYLAGRLVVRKTVSDYDYERDAWGNVMYGPNFYPYTKKIKDIVGDPVPASDSSREIRVMVIENLPGFIEFVRSSIASHTQTLNLALGNIRSI